MLSTAVPVRLLHAEKQPITCDSRVVDQNIDTLESGPGRRDQPFDIVWLCDVRLDGRGLERLAADLFARQTTAAASLELILQATSAPCWPRPARSPARCLAMPRSREQSFHRPVEQSTSGLPPPRKALRPPGRSRESQLTAPSLRAGSVAPGRQAPGPAPSSRNVCSPSPRGHSPNPPIGRGW